MLFYQALANCKYMYAVHLYKHEFVPIILWSPSENDSCKVHKYKL